MFKNKVKEELGKPFPDSPKEQLWGAIGAVFGSWMNQRAITYRRLNSIPADWGTAVNIQSMVFGNMGMTVPPVSLLPVTRPPVKIIFTANFSLMPRGGCCRWHPDSAADQ